MNESSEINIETSKGLASVNTRSRYTNGIVLAESIMRGRILNESMGGLIGAPGGLLAMRSINVLSDGGFDSVNDQGQIFRFAIRGDSGFDPEAMLYWRHHEAQANRLQKGMGLVYYRDYSNFPTRYDTRSLHMEVAGTDSANEFQTFWSWVAKQQALGSLKDSFQGFPGIAPGLRALRRLLLESPLSVSSKGLTWALWYVLGSGLRRILRPFTPKK